MIHIETILKKSWQILWNYRVLWIFGLLLAMTTGGPDSGPRYTFDGNNRRNQPGVTISPDRMSGEWQAWVEQFNRWAEQDLEPLLERPGEHIATLIWIVVGFVLFILVISLLTALVRYPAETAIIRMVDGYEQTGAKVGFRAGWRLGWSRRAFRIWVIDLLIGIPGFLFFLFIITIGVMIYFSVTSGSEATAVLGSLAAVGVFFVMLVVFIVLMAFLLLLRNLFTRAVALEDLGVGAALRRGWALFRAQWKNAALMWLVMFGIAVAFGLLALIIFFLLIPAYFLLFIPALFAGVVPGLLTYGLTSLFAAGPPAWIAAIIVGLMFFFLVLFSPLLVVGGWYRIYELNVWTLTYREITLLDRPAAPPAAEVEEALPSPS